MNLTRSSELIVSGRRAKSFERIYSEKAFQAYIVFEK